MTDLLGMGGYGAYVWASYLLFFAVLVADALAPVLRRRRTVAELAARAKREAARNSAGRPSP